MSNIHTYTNGSGYEGNTGVAAVLFQCSSQMLKAILCYHLGPTSDHTNVDTEGIGTILAVWLLRQMNINFSTSKMFTDIQNFMQILGKRGRKTGQYIQNEFIAMAEELWQHVPHSDLLWIQWISAHSKVHGNKMADAEAKQAALGHSSPSHLLPPLLHCCPLPISAVACKQKHMQELNRAWQKEWEASPQYQRFHTIDPNIHFAKFHKVTQKKLCLPHMDISCLVQIQTGHTPLASYLHKIGKMHMSRCPSCWEHIQIEIRETVQHFVLYCPGVY
ncbi:hypothetical protein BDQ12DRAFT_609576 [Crucibulum laeve]|uniref:RNase H type-1 domain-containing protein n=1 Tax=Crucibulum laeve TaxID=68775 RepID=A0A5C3LUR8_9AGAR|nr:hypothetical protein BDQ12DRAFT_609576 [Crucibulum laeve]